MGGPRYPRIAALGQAERVAARLAELGWPMPYDASPQPAPTSPLAAPLEIPWESAPGGRRRLGNRLAVQPMEGWDGERDGRPSELTRRRWLRFGRSGAKLIWGVEAVAVLPEARANPRQLWLHEGSAASLAALRAEMAAAHRERFGGDDDWIVGLQLTHSGRFSRPDGVARPLPAQRHALLERRQAAAAIEPISDAEVARIVAAYAGAARLAQQAGFDFVDLKHCHGYLAHELLGARSRPGAYGGSFQNRTRFLRELVAAVRSAAPGLALGVRLSAFDCAPYQADPVTRQGRPMAAAAEADGWGFGVAPDLSRPPDLSEARALLALLASLGVRLVNITAGSPYYCPHIQRPALFPPSDGYEPPEDPLAGAARLQWAARELKAAAPELVIVSSGWSYFQDFLPHFAQAAVREGATDVVGLGRMMLAYPELPYDLLQRARLERKAICRTFSDCTTAPRHGMVSGCYPLDSFYRARPEGPQVRALHAQINAAEKAAP
ncbi:MAG: hypothetical protein ACRD2H_16430 [Terriglobales bacterium]